MPPPSSALGSSLRPLVSLVVVTLLVAILSLAQAVIVPLALAAMLAFILVRPVTKLERIGLPRVPSVALMVLIVLAAIATFGYELTHQFDDFAAHMPEYAVSIKAKLATLRGAGTGAIGQIQDTVERVTRELDKQDAKLVPGAPAVTTPTQPVQPVSVVPASPSDVERLRAMLEPVLGPVATAGIVLILMSFMLVDREDIRNRVIRVVGQGRLTVTTKTLDEAGQRISRFLFVQSIINASFGIWVTVGLLFIGVPYALLWGVTAALLRFVPYIGSTLAMLSPAALALVSSESWWPAISTVALFLTMDGITAYIVEPVVIGTHTGVSSLALLISAMFWTWLWGPVGLVLSTPLTVCLAAVGKHVPEMDLLAVVLGDEPPLEADISFYQRLLAGDEDEATDIITQELGKSPRPQVFDHLIVPTLLRVERDRLRGEISPAEQQLVVQTILEILRQAADPTQPEQLAQADAPPQRRLLGVPARNTSDEVALEMLGQLLGKTWTVEQLSSATLASEVLRTIADSAPEVLCIAALPPGGFNHARYLCKRIHKQFPALVIWILRAGSNAEAAKIMQPLSADGASAVVTTFADAAIQLTQLALLEPKGPEPRPDNGAVLEQAPVPS